MDHFKIKQQKGILSIVIILIILLTINQNSVIIKGSIYSNSQEKSFEPKKLIENPKLETNPENITVLSYKMHLKIQTNFQFKVTSTFVLRNNNTEPLNFYIIDINQNISSVFVYDPIDSLSFSWKTDESYGNRINITLRYPLLSDDMTVFYIEYELQESIYQVNQPSQYYGFDFEINHTLATNTFTLEIDLPMYGSLIESDSPAAVSPDPNRIYTEDNIVKIIWERGSITKNDIDFFAVRFTFASTPCNNSMNLLPLYYILFAIGGLLVGGGGVFGYYYWKRKVSEKDKLLRSLLSNSERKIIDQINKDGGISTQTRICDETGYSKSKVSQLLQRLEKKDVLKRERWGRTNKVTITNPNFIDAELVEKEDEN